MNTWIFQSVPDQFDLRSPASLSAGEKITWYATRYRDQMTPGDTAYFWMAGDPEIRGIYGWGVLTTGAYMKPRWDSHGVDVRVEARFRRPILATAIRNDQHLNTLLILRQPAGSNFLLEADQAERLRRLVRDNGESAPSKGGSRG